MTVGISRKVETSFALPRSYIAYLKDNYYSTNQVTFVTLGKTGVSIRSAPTKITKSRISVLRSGVEAKKITGSNFKGWEYVEAIDIRGKYVKGFVASRYLKELSYFGDMNEQERLINKIFRNVLPLAKSLKIKSGSVEQNTIKFRDIRQEKEYIRQATQFDLAKHPFSDKKTKLGVSIKGLKGNRTPIVAVIEKMIDICHPEFSSQKPRAFSLLYQVPLIMTYEPILGVRLT